MLNQGRVFYPAERVGGLFKLMSVDDSLLPPGTNLHKDATFDRILSALGNKLPNHDAAAATLAVKTLRTINRARVGLQHSGASADLYDALTQLGLGFPIED